VVSGKPGQLKPNPAQIHRRMEKVLEWSKAGYTTHQIVRALRPAVTKSTIQKDRRALGRRLDGVPGYVITSTRPDPEPYDWWAEPDLVLPPAYQVSGPMPGLESALRRLRDGNARNRLAFNVDEAAAASDEKWFVGSQVTLAELAAYVDDLRAILDDGQARQAAKLPAARDDLKRPYNGPRGNTVPVPLPPAGSGVRPGRIHSMVWAYMYAGIPLDDAAVAAIAAAQGTTPERVRLAVAEMQAAGLG
jgi:hypothetical protein